MQDIISKCLPTYTVCEKLGEGIYGSVYRVHDGLKERAVKIVPLLVEKSVSLPGPQALDSKVSRDFLAVQEYYGRIKGDGVVEIHDFHLVNKRVTRDHAAAELVILMEYCPENLNSAVVDSFPLEPSRCISCMFQLASLLKRLCRISGDVFVITDLKPTNILVTTDGRIVIGDLGGLKRVNSLSATLAAQFSPSWTAPEIMLRGDAPGILSTVYAYGLVSYFAWEGSQPYPDSDFISRISMIRDGGVSFARNDIPADVKNLILKCLSFSPKDRPWDFDEILARISDIKTGFIKKILNVSKTEPEHIRLPESEKIRNSDDFKDLPVYGNTGPKDARAGDVWRESGLGMEFVWVPGGFREFGEDRKVLETGGFWIGRYPVTQGQWKKLMGYNPSHFAKGDNYPVEGVSWNEVQSFVRNLSSRNAGKYSFSLPSEACWEYAADSGGSESWLYAGSDDSDAVAWHRHNSGLSTHPVGRKTPNAIGIYDMSGNVMEWCEDVFSMNDYGAGGAKNIYRVSKGGSWRQDAASCRIIHRHKAAEGLGYSDLGFRITRLADS